MPEPRCGRPGSSTSAILRPTTRLTTWPLRPLRAAPHRERPLLGDGLARPVVVHSAPVDGLVVVCVRDLPDLGDILERGDEALARGGVVHRRHARTPPAIVLDLHYL